MIHNIPQPAFEEIISERLAQSRLVEIRKNHSFVSLEQVSVNAPLRRLQYLIFGEIIDRRLRRYDH